MRIANQTVKRRELKALAEQTRVPPHPERVRPFFIRLPPTTKGAKCVWTGLSRSVMADLCVKSARVPHPPVESFLIKKPGAKHAVRLIVFESLMAYLQKLREIEAQENGATAPP
jgi:hypothetical protein